MEEILNIKPKIHVFICINDRSIKDDLKVSCGPFVNGDVIKELKLWIRENNLVGIVQITKTGCLGGCNKDGAVAVSYPDGRFYKGFKGIQDLKNYITDLTKNA